MPRSATRARTLLLPGALALCWAAADGARAGAVPAADRAPVASAADAAAPPPTAALPVAALRGGAAVPSPMGVSRFRTFRAADGLRNLVVLALAQDRRGQLWVGTDEGLYRFDGARFTAYLADQGLPSVHIASIAAAPRGGVCVVGAGKLACSRGDRFAEVTVGAGLVRAVASHGDELWVATSRGLYVRRGDAALDEVAAWRGHDVIAVIADARGAVATDGKVVGLSDERGSWRMLEPLPPAAAAVGALVREPGGGVWMRSLEELWFLPAGAARAELRSSPETRARESIAMALGPGDALLLATERGISMLTRRGWRLLGRAQGVPQVAVRALFTDRDGSVWVGAGGLHQWMGRGLVERFDAEHGLPGESVWVIGRDRRGVLWVGTDHCLAEAVADGWRCVPRTEGMAVRTRLELADGGAIFGGVPAALWHLSPEGAVRQLEALIPASAQQVLDLELGPDGALWVGTNRGLFRVDIEMSAPAELVAALANDPGGFVSSVVRVGDELWVAGRGGVAALRGGRWHPIGVAQGLAAPQVSYLLPRRDGSVCAAYDEALGVGCFRTTPTGLVALRSLGPGDGLSAGRVYFLGEDLAGRLWVGTGAGVDLVAGASLDHFTERDGLAGDDANANAFFVDDDGSVWLGSSTGLTHVAAQHYRGPPPPPIAVIERARVGPRGRRLGPGEALRHDDRDVVLEFSAASTLDTGALELAVRMLPQSTEWRSAALRAEHYVSLPAGNYRFEVRARLGRGAWGPVDSYQFTVMPAFWQRRWFQVLVLGLGAMLVGTALALRQRWVSRRDRRLHLARAEANFRELIERLPELVLVRREGELEYGNQAARQVFGVGEGERWRQAALLERVVEADRGRLGGLLAGRPTAAATGSARRAAGATGGEEPLGAAVEVRVRAGDGTQRELELAVQQVELGGRQAELVIGRDITERKRLQGQLLVADRMISLGTLATGIAHEINNPLACVMGNLGVALESLDADPQAPLPASERAALTEVLRDSEEGAERVRKIVLALRAFSRAEAQQKSELSVNPLVERALALSGNELRHRAQVRTELSATATILADEARLTQVIIALLVNAAQAIVPGRASVNTVTVRTRSDADNVVIEVQDTGSGVPATVLPRVFDPFFTTKPVGTGAGLGLSICHGIVTSLGGQISLDSALGHGTTVRVTLPAFGEPARSAAAAAAPVPQGAAASSQSSVLIVDDDVQVGNVLRRMLDLQGGPRSDITVVGSVAEAMRALRDGRRYDAIVSDVMMPEQSGLDLYDLVRSLDRTQAERLIFVTGGAFASESQRRLEELGRPCLTKPVRPEELWRAVARVATSAHEAASSRPTAPG